VLRINPDLVEAHCRTDEHLFLLVMHELHHVLLGHTRLFPRSTPLHNLAFDAVINALLCLRFPEPAYTSFFSGLYGTSEGSARLLAPPSTAVTGDATLDALHESIYTNGGITAQEIFETIQRVAPPPPSGLLLLGSHGEDVDSWGTDSAAAGDVIVAIREIVERWPRPRDVRLGRSLSDLMDAHSIEPATPERAVRTVVSRALCAAATRPGGPRVPTEATVDAQVVLPTLQDRRATVARALARNPLLYRRPIPDSRGKAGRRAPVYLDVSGSMDAYLALLYGALRSLRAHVAPEVHVFSTVVRTVPLEALCRGRVESTGGTDIHCVLEHALGTGASRVLVVTDGYVGSPNASLRRRYGTRGPELRVLLTPGGWRSDLEPLAARIDVLPTL
jgi:hypothetical protein